MYKFIVSDKSATGTTKYAPAPTSIVHPDDASTYHPADSASTYVPPHTDPANVAVPAHATGYSADHDIISNTDTLPSHNDAKLKMV